MSTPLVSVCIGVYNREQYIRECLDSVFSQTYPRVEVVVADNASSDGTLDIVRSYPGVRVVQRQTNSGMCSTTRNMAVQAAKGELIAFLDSDDAWYPDKLHWQVAFLEEHQDIPLCHTYCHLMDEDSNVYGVRHEGRLPPTGNYFDALLNHCWITISSVLMRAELYREIGPFNETLPYGQSGEDYEYFLKVARTYDVGLVPEVLTKYRKSKHSITAGNWRATPVAVPFFRELLRREDIWGGRTSLACMRQRYESACCENSAYWRDQGFPGRALWAAGKALQVNPFHRRAWAQWARSFFRLIVPIK